MTPTFTCFSCDQAISRRRDYGHHVLVMVAGNFRVICLRCSFRRDVHATFWPDCRVTWHAPWEHEITSGTAEVIRAALEAQP